MIAPRFLDAGECALTVEFGNRIDDALIAQVHDLDAALLRQKVSGIIETVPTYRSLMVHYDPLILSRPALVDCIRGALGAASAEQSTETVWHVPACYDASFGEDLPVVSAATGLSAAEIVELHLGATYEVAMYGFAPGWAYLSGLPQALTLPRRTSPRDRIPAGSLIIAGGQAIVAAMEMPSGWHILGRTPERLFSPGRDRPFLLSPGDRLRFHPVDLPTFRRLEAQAARGEIVSRSARA
jgi:KipI family sensor histidine kinase inhibitor